MGRLAEWRHCPRCATAIEPVEGGAKVECPSCGFVEYAHSSVTACALVVDGAGRVLLARRAVDPYRGRWDLPGGFVGEGEHPLDAIRRELQEETGLDVEPDRFVGVWVDRYSEDGEGVATLNLYWTAHPLGGELRAADDVSDAGWFAADELPSRDELAFHIASVLDAWRNQDP